MKAFVIALKNNKYSNEVADRCIESGKLFGIHVEKFYGVEKEVAEKVMAFHRLKWTWANYNSETLIDRKTNLQQFPYTTTDLRAKIGCSMSHYLLWKMCIALDEPILILEHDAVFIRAMPENIEFKGICQINDPAGATRRGGWWSQEMIKRGGEGAFEKTWVTKPKDRHIPDGLAGNSAYMVKPWAAKELVNKFHELGVWPNDAIMCKQLFPYLEEYYPFITKVVQSRSTSGGQ